MLAVSVHGKSMFLWTKEELAFSSFGGLLKEKISREYLLIYLVTKAVKVPGIRLGVLKWKGLDRNVLSVSETQGYVKIICTEQGVSGFRKRCCLALQSAQHPVLLESCSGTESIRLSLRFFWKGRLEFISRNTMSFRRGSLMLQRHPKPHFRHQLLCVAFPAL